MRSWLPPTQHTAELAHAHAHVARAATEQCQVCVSYEQDVTIVVASTPRSPDPLRPWSAFKHYD